MAAFDRLWQILSDAIELPAGRRAAYLDIACPDEPELRKEVESLLQCAEPAAMAFDAATRQIVDVDPQRVGPYTLLEPVGEGGMAIVYRAQQSHPVRRTVALKLIKMGMDTRQFIARFESERQALAMMDHPNIAQVFDAGSTETGRPYFVMEYVSGPGILEYCDQRDLSLGHRLQLFRTVCEAAEHAHRKGIIHRDLKDTNVLVTEVDGKPVPKVIDFGIAKAIQQPLTDRTVYTEQGQLIGTPEYMSPEQAEHRMADIDTRSDVYSLGVLLYELIAGVQPIPSNALREAGFDQVMRIIRDTDAPRPSTRLSTLSGDDAERIALHRRTPLPTLIRNLKSELEWIPLKAMRKERERRYQSAAALAEDIDNYLAHRPLIAGPESGWYRTRKFLRRHKTGTGAVLASALLLVGGIITTTWQAVRASRERDSARATLEFLTEDVLSAATPERIPNARVRQEIVDAMITPAAKGVAEKFSGRPLTEASVREAIQTVLREIGRSELALPHAEAVLAIRRRELGRDNPETLQSLNDLGRILRAMGRLPEAEAMYREALEGRRRVLGEDHKDFLSSLNNYALALERLGRLVEAEQLLKEALERRRRVLGEDDSATILSLNNYAHVLLSMGRLAESERLYREALERRQRTQGADHPLTLLAVSNYADVLGKLERWTEAEPLTRSALEGYVRVMGDEHPSTLTARANYAFMLGQLDRPGDSAALYRRVLDQRRRVLGDDHLDTLWTLSQYSGSLGAAGQLDEAAGISRTSFERHRSVLGADHRSTLMAQNHYAEALLRLDRAVDAEALLIDQRERCSRVLGEDHDWTLESRLNHVRALLLLGRAAEAEPEARAALESAIRSASVSRRPNATRQLATGHADCLDALGRHDEAATVRREFGLPVPTTQRATEPANNRD